MKNQIVGNQKPIALVVAVFVFSLLTGCDIWNGGSDIDEDIQSFVEVENLPEAQTPEISFADSESEVKAFRVEFGPGCDCPSGCLYSKGYGLKFQDRIGWMEVKEFFCLEDSVRSEANFFEVRPGDSTLFDSDLRLRFRTSAAEESEKYAPVYEAFLQMIAQDGDTPTNTLSALGDLLYEERLSDVGEALIENPVVRSSQALLEKLANLPDRRGYRSVKEKAQELLDQISEQN
jgi:hypothetical protein